MLQDVSVLAAEFLPELEIAMVRTAAALFVREKVKFKVKANCISKILNTVWTVFWIKIDENTMSRAFAKAH
jgi:hypothetical protein